MGKCRWNWPSNSDWEQGIVTPSPSGSLSQGARWVLAAEIGQPNLKYITRLALVNSIRISKNFAWHRCLWDVINFSIQSGFCTKLAARTNENKAYTLGGPLGAPHCCGSLAAAVNFQYKPPWIEKLITSKRQWFQEFFLYILIEFTKANLMMYFKL